MTNLAFIFPGQGSQSVGMLSEISLVYPSIYQVFEEASDTLSYDLWKITQEGPTKTLDQTSITQPIMLTASIALMRLYLEQGGPLFSILAGHSLGEYTALVAAGCLSLSEALKLVDFRGKSMENALLNKQGAMAAILGLKNDTVLHACSEAAQGEVVNVANFNSPGQVVISGNKSAVNRAINLCRIANAKRTIVLSVSVPSHCSLMLPASKDLAEFIERLDWKKAKKPIVQNFSGNPVQNIQGLKSNLVKQLSNPVRWVESIEYLVSNGFLSTIECGPGKVLTNLSKRCSKELNTYSLGNLVSFEKTLELLA